MKIYCSSIPPCFSTSSPAAEADPPANVEHAKAISVSESKTRHRIQEQTKMRTGGYHVVDDNDRLPRRDGVRLHFKLVLYNRVM